MADSLELKPEFRAVVEHRKASSDCHGAKLNAGEKPGTWICRRCGQPCQRILGEPVRIEAHG